MTVGLPPRLPWVFGLDEPPEGRGDEFVPFTVVREFGDTWFAVPSGGRGTYLPFVPTVPGPAVLPFPALLFPDVLPVPAVFPVEVRVFMPPADGGRGT